MKAIPSLLVGLVLAMAIPATAQDIPTSPTQIQPLLIGAAVPEAQVFDLDGSPMSLTAILDSKPTVLVFFRGGW